MKRKLIFLVLLFLLFALFVLVKFVFLSSSKKEGRLQVLSSPNANIIVNDKAAGRTPYDTALPEGEYGIKLIVDSESASESASWEGTVKVYGNTRTFVSREVGINDITSSGVIMTVLKMTEKPTKARTGQIEVQTDPDGSIVYLDDEEQGIAPLILSDIPEGDHELSVYSPGFFRRSQKVKIKSGYKVLAEYKLAVDPSHKKVEKEPEKISTDEASLLTPTPTGKTTKTTGLTMISIDQTDTGWLRVRFEPTLAASEAAKVKPGDRFAVLEEKSGWYKIEYIKGKLGWISAEYTHKETSQ